MSYFYSFAPNKNNATIENNPNQTTTNNNIHVNSKMGGNKALIAHNRNSNIGVGRVNITSNVANVTNNVASNCNNMANNRANIDNSLVSNLTNIASNCVAITNNVVSKPSNLSNNRVSIADKVVPNSIKMANNCVAMTNNIANSRANITGNIVPNLTNIANKAVASHSNFANNCVAITNNIANSRTNLPSKFISQSVPNVGRNRINFLNNRNNRSNIPSNIYNNIDRVVCNSQHLLNQRVIRPSIKQHEIASLISVNSSVPLDKSSATGPLGLRTPAKQMFTVQPSIPQEMIDKKQLFIKQPSSFVVQKYVLQEPKNLPIQKSDEVKSTFGERYRAKSPMLKSKAKAFIHRSQPQLYEPSTSSPSSFSHSKTNKCISVTANKTVDSVRAMLANDKSLTNCEIYTQKKYTSNGTIATVASGVKYFLLFDAEKQMQLSKSMQQKQKQFGHLQQASSLAKSEVKNKSIDFHGKKVGHKLPMPTSSQQTLRPTPNGKMLASRGTIRGKAISNLISKQPNKEQTKLQIKNKFLAAKGVVAIPSSSNINGPKEIAIHCVSKSPYKLFTPTKHTTVSVPLF